MARTMLIRGMLAGLVAGFLVFGFGKVFGEPQVDRAITFETAMDAAKAQAERALNPSAPVPEPEPELVSRPVQAGLGLFTGTMVYSVALGGLFSLVFAYAYGRVGPADPKSLAMLLAGAALLAIYVVPNLKYPANPPSVGEPETIALRTGLYFTMLAVSIAAMVGAIALRGALVRTTGSWYAGAVAAAAYLVVVAAAGGLLPSVNEVPEDFPAVLLWQFRIVAFGMQLVLWTTTGLVFGALMDRVLAGRRSFTLGGQAYRPVR